MIRKGVNLVIYLTFILCCLVSSFQVPLRNQMAVTKNSKLSNIQIRKSLISNVALVIRNNPQSTTFEIPYNQTLRNGSNLELLPLEISENIISRGYLYKKDKFKSSQLEAESETKASPFWTGYKVLKTTLVNLEDINATQRLRNSAQQFYDSIFNSSDLNLLNIRSQDTFELVLQINQEASQLSSSTKLQIKSLTVQYLYPTVILPAQFITSNQLITVQTTASEPKDQKVTVERRLSGSGFHQEVNTTLFIPEALDIQIQQRQSESENTVCFYEFEDILPESTYIDYDERRSNIESFELINIELPAMVSKQYFYRFRVPFAELQQVGVRKYLFKQPIHFRYPAPTNGNVTQVALHAIEGGRIFCKENEQSKRLEVSVSEHSLINRGSVNLPHGDLSMKKTVSITTLVVCVASVLLITRELKKGR